jgi:uncharacterized membrane protein YdbT with pleckstrin-like domain
MSYLESLMSDGETVQVSVRQHWVVLLRSLLANGVTAAVLILVSGVGTGWDAPVGRWVAGGALVLLSVPAFLVLRDLAAWSARQYVVTTRRVIEIDGVFNKHVSDSNLDKVNDLVMRQSVPGRLLGYGDIEIITGSDIGLNHLERITRPMEFQKVMLDNKEDLDTIARMSGPVGAPGASVTEAIERLAELRDKGVVSAEEFERKKAELLARL